jgi:hypothetical protein
MAWERQAIALTGNNRGLWRMCWFAASIAGAILLGGASAQAVPGSGCDAINQGALNVELEPAASVTREVTLGAGDTITFGYRTDAPNALGLLTLAHGAGSPRLLLAGPNGTAVSYAARARGQFGFEFASEGDGGATFTATCTSSSLTRRRQAPRTATAPGRFAAAILSDPRAAELETEALADTTTFEPAAPAPSKRWPSGEGIAQGSLSRLPRYEPAAGTLPEARSAVGGAKYKLLPDIMVGVLAQFEQPDRTQVAGERSVADEGWMAGPITTLQLAPGTTLDARAAWGTVETGLPATGTQQHSVNARLANTQAFGPWRLTPSVVVSVNRISSTASRSAGEASTVTSTPGRDFFICTGVR